LQDTDEKIGFEHLVGERSFELLVVAPQGRQARILERRFLLAGP
jgi:hypothetical protein